MLTFAMKIKYGNLLKLNIMIKQLMMMIQKFIQMLNFYNQPIKSKIYLYKLLNFQTKIFKIKVFYFKIILQWQTYKILNLF